MERQQRKLFYENYRAALREDCKAIGDDLPSWSKVVGKLLFPEIVDATAAGRKLDDMTNPNRRDRLNDEQERLVMRMAKDKQGFSAALDFICDETDFERTRPRDRKDEALELQSRAERLHGELRQTLERMERLAKTPLELVVGRQA